MSEIVEVFPDRQLFVEEHKEKPAVGTALVSTKKVTAAGDTSEMRAFFQVILWVSILALLLSMCSMFKFSMKTGNDDQGGRFVLLSFGRAG